MIAAAAIAGLLIGNTALADGNKNADSSNTDQHNAKTKSMDNHSCNGCPNGCPSQSDTTPPDSKNENHETNLETNTNPETNTNSEKESN